MASSNSHYVHTTKSLYRACKSYLPELNWLAIHWAYFILTCLFSAILLWVTATPFRSLTFTDALFLATSAMTEAGLNTVNLSTLNTFQQIVLLLLIIMGSAIFVSASIIFLRVKAFEREFAAVIRRQRDQKQKRRMTSISRRQPRFSSPASRLFSSPIVLDRIEREEQPLENSEDITSFPTISPQRGRRRSRYSDTTVFAQQASIYPSIATTIQPNTTLYRAHVSYEATVSNVATHVGDSKVQSELSTVSDHDRRDSISPLVPVGRNSQFHGLSFSERQRLGGYEYRAVVFLSFLVPTYLIIWQLLGSLSCGAWIAYHRASTALENGMSPWWVGAFNAVSAFNNSGMSLLDANMVRLRFSSSYSRCSDGYAARGSAHLLCSRPFFFFR